MDWSSRAEIVSYWGTLENSLAEYDSFNQQSSRLFSKELRFHEHFAAIYCKEEPRSSRVGFAQLYVVSTSEELTKMVFEDLLAKTEMTVRDEPKHRKALDRSLKNILEMHVNREREKH